MAGRILAAQGNASRAAKILTEAWKTSQHPDIALIYAYARSGDAPRDRLARVKSLVASGPASLEGDIAVAVAAIEAKDWAAARLALEPHLANTPPARVCRLMARIEAGQNRNSGRVREWLAKAARVLPIRFGSPPMERFQQNGKQCRRPLADWEYSSGNRPPPGSRRLATT